MTVKLLTEHLLEFLSLKGGCTGSYESTLVKMPHCWQSHVRAHILCVCVLLCVSFNCLYSSLSSFGWSVIIMVIQAYPGPQQCSILTSVDSDKPVSLLSNLETPNDVQSVA